MRKGFFVCKQTEVSPASGKWFLLVPMEDINKLKKFINLQIQINFQNL